MTMDHATARERLIELFRSAVAAVAPGPALARALAHDTEPPHARPWIIALGKAAHAMAEAAVRVLERRGTAPAGGVIVAPRAFAAPHPSLAVAPGDHPEPGPGSRAAAERIGDVAARVGAGDEVWVLLSGGATSLAAAPVDGVTPAELRALFGVLLGSGLDIAATNAVRKRFTRWGAGRLALALAPARVRVFAISDVIGDDLGAIGSGPCAPDPARAADVRKLLADAGLWHRLPPSLGTVLARAERDASLETAKPGDAAFERVESHVIASNEIAVRGAAARAREIGFDVRVDGIALHGEAADMGLRFAQGLTEDCGSPTSPSVPPRRVRCVIVGGETVVTLGADGARGAGGRCQEFALAAARALALPSATTIRAGWSVLAAGTDGRDGPTDAAGAIVNAGTWAAIRQAGRDPEADLAAHDAYRALDAAGALVRTGATGTNVADVVIGLCSPEN